MRLLALLAAALLLTVFQAQAQVYGPYDDYDEYGGYGYDDPYGAYPPPPEWRPTASMRQKNPRLPAVVGPGPKNPLGTRAIYLADGLLRIHGTNDPSSIGTNASSGCFRMYRQDVEELYEMVQPGTRVIVER